MNTVLPLETFSIHSQTISSTIFNDKSPLYNNIVLDHEDSLKHFKKVKFKQAPKPPIAEANEKSLSSIHTIDSPRKDSDFKGKPQRLSKKLPRDILNIEDLIRHSIFKPMQEFIRKDPELLEYKEKRAVKLKLFSDRIINSRCYKYMMHIFLTINILCLVFKDEFTEERSISVISGIKALCNCFFLIDVFINGGSQGFFRTKMAFFKDALNIGQFISIFFGFLTLLIEKPSLILWENLRLLKILSLNPYLRKTFYHLFQSLAKVRNHLLFLLIVITVYALIGVFFFKGKIENRCRLTPFPINNSWPINASSLTLCGEYQCPLGSYCGNPAQYDIARNDQEYSNDLEIYDGVFNFDDILNSLFTSLIFIGITGWSDINDIFWKSTDKFFTGFYTFSYVFLISTILINMVVAGLYENLFTNNTMRSTMITVEKPRITTENKTDGNLNTVFDQFLKPTLGETKSTNRHNPLDKLKSGVTKLRSKYTNLLETQITLRIVKFKEENIIKMRMFSFLLIVFNCLILCVDYDNLDENTLKIMNRIDFAMLMVFYVEITIKLVVQKRFFKRFINLIDFLLFLLNLSVQIYLASIKCNFLDNCQSRLYMIVRSLQVLRIFRILVSSLWTNISILIIEFIKILRKMLDFLITAIIFLTIFSLIGRDLFIFTNRNTAIIIEEDELQRVNFNGFFNAFFTNFLIFIAEEWHLIMLVHLKAFNQVTVIIYFVINLLFSTIFLNKIFLASLINNLIESKNIKRMIEGKFSKLDKIKTFFLSVILRFKLLKSFLNKINEEMRTSIKKVSIIMTSKVPPSFDPHDSIKKNSLFKKEKTLNENKKKSIIITRTSKKESLKKQLRKLKNHRYFATFMQISVVLSLIILAIHDPYQSQYSNYNSTLTYLDIGIFIIFASELLIELYLHENGYFSMKIIMQLFICLVYLIYLSYQLDSLKLLLIFRMFLVINFSKELKLTFNALLKSLLDILQLFFFFILISVVFALIGVKCFKGAFYYCDGLDSQYLVQINNKIDCLDWGGDWINQDFNFDNIFKALELMFVTANSEGWLPLMYWTIDSVGRDQQAMLNFNKGWMLFFFIYGILGHFFLINIIIAILVEKYIATKNKLDKSNNLNEFQKEWKTIKHMILKMKPKQKKVPQLRIQTKILKFIKHKSTINFFLFLNLLNLGVHFLIFHRENPNLEKTIYIMSFMFNVLFLFETILSVIAMPRSLFHTYQMANILFVVCSAVIFNLFVVQSNQDYNESHDILESFLVSMQIFRFFLIMKHVKFIKNFIMRFKTIIIKAFPIIVLFFIILFFYGLIGAQLFPYLKTQKYVNSPDINFSNIFYSMFTLYRIATIENWYFLLADCSRLMQSNFVCYPVTYYQDYEKYGQNGCGTLWAYPFIFSFYIIILLIFNLLVGIMINISGSIRKHEESSVNIYQLGDIRKLWAEYDSKGYGYIDYKDFWVFSSRIALILGVKTQELLDFETKKRFLKILDLKVYEDVGKNNIFCLNFHEVVLSLSRIAVMIKNNNVPNFELDIIDHVRERSLQEIKNYKETYLTSGMIANLMDLKSRIRKWKNLSQIKKNRLKYGTQESLHVVSSFENTASLAKSKCTIKSPTLFQTIKELSLSSGSNEEYQPNI